MNMIESNLLQALIITKNEEPNIQRVLNKLTWIEKVVVLDSFSTDATLEILAAFPNVSVRQRAFDTFAGQCNYGLDLMDSEWVLSLDADYVLTDEFIAETQRFLKLNDPDISAYCTRFKFLIYGKELLSNNTTSRPVLFRRSACAYVDDGHAHRLIVNGNEKPYKSFILHDDRKSLSTWLSNQDKYSIREREKLLNGDNTNSMIIKIRRTKVFAPIIVFFYCLLVKGLIFNGWFGWYYTLQRTMVEMLFALRMIEKDEFKI
jgi:glycosyltransferase involved in cell wall biosynthesis